MTRPFQFDRDFDSTDPIPRPLDRPMTAIETAVAAATIRLKADFETRLQRACADAEAVGRLAGRQEGEDRAAASLGAETERLARAIAESVPVLQAELNAQVKGATDELVHFVAELLEKLLPGLEAELGELRLERFLERALRDAPKVARLAVSVPEGALPMAEAALERLGPQLGTPIAVHLRGDAELEEGEARATWEQGGMALQPSRVAKAIIDACAKLAGRAGSRGTRQRREKGTERSAAVTMETRS